MQVRFPFAVLALFGAYGVGVASTHLIEREARAQAATRTASVYVPPEGLVFRALDGRAIARLSYDARGGAFEVYDSREHSAGALRAAVATDAPPALPAATVATVTAPGDIDLGY